MAQWSVLLPAFGRAQTIEAEAVEVVENGDLVALGSQRVALKRWRRDKWSHFRNGVMPFKEGDPPGVENAYRWMK